MVNGKQKSVACCKYKGGAYKKLILAYKDKKKIKPNKEKEYTLFSRIEHWHEVYRMPKFNSGKLSNNTLISNLATIKRIKKKFKDIKLKDLKADYIQQKIDSMT